MSEYFAGILKERDKSRKLKYLKSTNGNDAQFIGLENKMVGHIPVGRGHLVPRLLPDNCRYCLILKNANMRFNFYISEYVFLLTRHKDNALI